MTREEKLQAFTMRLDGYTCREIGEKMGYTSQNISDSLLRVLRTRRRRNRCIYPAISAWMNEQVLTDATLAGRIGYAPKTVTFFLRGYNPPSREFRRIMEKQTGLSGDVLFQVDVDG